MHKIYGIIALISILVSFTITGHIFGLINWFGDDSQVSCDRHRNCKSKNPEYRMEDFIKILRK